MKETSRCLTISLIGIKASRRELTIRNRVVTWCVKNKGFVVFIGVPWYREHVGLTETQKEHNLPNILFDYKQCSCIVASISHAVFVLQGKEKAIEIMSVLKKIEQTGKGISWYGNEIFKFGLQMRRKGLKDMYTFENYGRKMDCVLVVRLCGVDNGTTIDHVVCVDFRNGVIYDNALEVLLPLTVESLQSCAGTHPDKRRITEVREICLQGSFRNY